MDVGMMMVYAGYGWENIKVVEKRHPGLDRVVCSMVLGTPLAMALEQLERFRDGSNAGVPGRKGRRAGGR
jgi:hypothetical protein